VGLQRNALIDEKNLFLVIARESARKSANANANVTESAKRSAKGRRSVSESEREIVSGKENEKLIGSETVVDVIQKPNLPA
jgi:anti-sigma28 factor (negative regulator of flagellin synthesis)